MCRDQMRITILLGEGEGDWPWGESGEGWQEELEAVAALGEGEEAGKPAVAA